MNPFIALLCTISTFILSIEPVSANPIYQWFDNEGKWHFSDRASISVASTIFQGEELVTIVMVKAAPLKKHKTSKIKNRKKTKNKNITYVSQCKRLKNKITLLEKSFEQRLQASKFDQINRELHNLRWQKIKSC